MTAVDIDRDGRSVWVLERCGGMSCAESTLAPILKLDASGAVVASFGAGMFVVPHGLHVDRDGNIWATDASDGQPATAGKGHQVFKFSPDGRLLMTLGKAGVAGAGTDVFNRPSDVTVDGRLSAFIADRTPQADPITAAEAVAVDADGTVNGAVVPAQMLQKHVRQ